MPAGDGTGPLGQGSQTGRGAGFCSGNSAPGFQSSGRNFGGRGLRNFRNFGRGRRFFNGFAANTFEAENQMIDETESLKKQSQILMKRLEAIQNRIAELEKE